MRAIALSLGAALLLVSNGHTVAPVATIASAAAFIVFLNGARPLARLAVSALIFAAAHCFIWVGIIPASGGFYYAAASAYGLSHFVPYIVQRALRTPAHALVQTLTFAAAYVIVEALLEWLTPYGSWSSLAYTQQPEGAFGQLAALGGAPLVTFFIAWSGAILAWLWERRAETQRVAVALCGAVLILSAMSAAPVVRLGALGEPRAIIRIAALSPDPGLARALDREMNDAGPSDRAVAAARALNDDMLSRTIRATEVGARIVVWSETAARVLKRDEEAFLATAARIARAHNAFVFAAYGAFDPGAARPFQNRLAAVSPSAGVVWIFDKAHPIVGTEANSTAAGAVHLPVVNTPYGRVGAIICHDADFPAFVRQAARRSVDLLLNPADDWRVIQHLHADMARYRAVENGVTMLRAANGVSFLADPLGRVLATRNSLAGDGPEMIALAPIRRAPIVVNGTALTLIGSILILTILAGVHLFVVLRRGTA